MPPPRPAASPPPKDSAIWSAANCGGRTVFLENIPAWVERVAAKVPGLEVHMVRRPRGSTRSGRRPRRFAPAPRPAPAGRAPPPQRRRLAAPATDGRAPRPPAAPPRRPRDRRAGARPPASPPGRGAPQVNYTSSLDRPYEFFKSPSEPKMAPAMQGTCWDVVLVDSPRGYLLKDGQPGRFQPVYWAINMARRCIAAGTKGQASGEAGRRGGAGGARRRAGGGGCWRFAPRPVR
jgi:hypothetical protein